MFDAFYISAIGLQAQKEQLDAAASNLANVSTTAFKRQSVDFAVLLERVRAAEGIEPIEGEQLRPNRLLRIDLTPGEVRATGRALDVAIVGDGFFEVELPGDRTGYTRVGAMQIDPEGVLRTLNGHALKVDVRIPAGATDVQIQRDGSVTAVLSGEKAATTLGQLELVRFDYPERLQYRGEGLFTTAPDESMEPMRSRPGEEGAAELAVRSLEGSNVQMVDEMVSLMMMQRVYELNSKVAQAADELMGMSNNMRRS